MADRHQRTQNFSENAKKKNTKFRPSITKHTKFLFKFIWIFFLETHDQWIVSTLFIPTLARRHWQWGQEFCKAIFGSSRYLYVHLTLLLPSVGLISLLSWLLFLSIWQQSAGTAALLKQMENFSGNLARSLPCLKRDSRRYRRSTESILPPYTIITPNIGKKYILLSLLCVTGLCRILR